MSYTETMLEYVYDQYCLSYNMEDALDFIEDEIDFTREEIKDMIQHTMEVEASIESPTPQLSEQIQKYSVPPVTHLIKLNLQHLRIYKIVVLIRIESYISIS